MKKIFTFVILPFMFFNNLTFSAENATNEVVSTVKTSDAEKNIKNEKVVSNVKKMSVGDKLRIGSSGIMDLISNGCFIIGVPAAVISGVWLFTSFSSPACIAIADPLITVTIPGIVGLGGLLLSGIGVGIDYLSEKIMPSEKKPVEVVEETQTPSGDITTNGNSEVPSLNKKMLSVSSE